MALAVRELELVLIARDNASAVIARVGGAMVILGGALTTVGIKGVRALGEMTTEAVDFRQEIALAVTQTDILGTSIEDVADIVNRVGSEIPVPFEELNEAMFDIFSTFTSDQLSNLTDAEGILRLFAESAMAGQAPVRDVARSTIAWINALDQPATVENVTRLLDIQFELIRKGAGTYGEFAGEVGKSIPAFAAANQSVETFGGIMAFLTKNGLSASMAATSAARAAELMFSPKAIQGLKDVGIAVEDNSGKFRSMEDIIRDLRPVMGDLSDSEFKIQFKEIFGTGRIQARRFFDLAIPNFEELDFLIGEMEASGGSVAEAFAFMMDQPGAQIDLFKNKWEALRRVIGDQFIETLQTRVFPVLRRLFEWWEELDPEMQKQIARWLGLAAAGSIVVGIVIGLLGVLLLLKALLSAFAGPGKGAIVGLGKLGLSLGWIAIIIAIIAGLAYLLWKNWDKVFPFLVDMWDKIQTAVSDFVEANRGFFDTMLEKARVVWEKILELGVAIWERAKAIWETIWAAMLVFWEKWGDDIMATLEVVWGYVQDGWIALMDILIGALDFFIALFNGDWGALWQAVQDIAASAWEFIRSMFGAWLAILAQIWRIAWDKIKQIADDIWDGIFEFLRGIWNRIWNTATEIWNNIVDFFKNIWESITRTAQDTIEGKGGLLEFFQNLPGRIIAAVFDLTSLFITWIGEALGALLEASGAFIGNVLIPFYLELPGRILRTLTRAPGFLRDVGADIMRGLLDGIKWTWTNLIVPYYTSFLPRVLAFFVNAGRWLFYAGMDVLRGLWTGIIWVWTNLVQPWLEGIRSAIIAGIGQLGMALYNAGRDVIQGFWNGMKSIWGSVSGWVSDKFSGITRAVRGVLGMNSPSKVFMDLGENTMKGYYLGLQKQMKSVDLLTSDFIGHTLPQGFGPNAASSNVTNNNDRGQVFQFGDIISQADPDEIAAAIAWELRMI